MNDDSGIYQIRNLINDKIYIGSAIDLKWRNRQHFSDLKYNRHFNKYLQRAYNKYGIENFIFEVLIYCDEENCLLFEQRFLDYYWNKGILYNTNPIAGNSLGYKHTEESLLKMSKIHQGHITSDEVKQKISKSLQGNINGLGYKPSAETRLKLSEAAKGRKHTEETKRKIGEANKGNTNKLGWRKIK